MNEWDNEPDRKHWIDVASGFDCLIVRNPVSGALCGYVGVPPGHLWYGKGYNDIDAEVHGGLTFAARCDGLICHDENSEAVANADVWWLGFDCAHFLDFLPNIDRTLKSIGAPNIFGNTAVYRNITYVEAECRSLAAQAKASGRET